MKKLIIIFLISLTACVKQTPLKYDKIEMRAYVLTGLDKPKHFYVDLQDVRTGKKYKHVYVSKHCNAYRQLRIGGVYNLKRLHWTVEGVEYADFDDCSLREVFCKSCN